MDAHYFKICLRMLIQIFCYSFYLLWVSFLHTRARYSFMLILKISFIFICWVSSRRSSFILKKRNNSGYFFTGNKWAQGIRSLQNDRKHCGCVFGPGSCFLVVRKSASAGTRAVSDSQEDPCSVLTDIHLHCLPKLLPPTDASVRIAAASHLPLRPCSGASYWVNLGNVVSRFLAHA